MPSGPLRDEANPSPRRRTVLAGLATACLPPIAAPVSAEASTEHEAFLAISKFLTGRPSLDPEQSTLLLEALVADVPKFLTEVRGLLAWIGERKVEARQLQRTLDTEGAALAPLPRKIVEAWYTGVVGEGERARCVTFETSLMHQAVADRLSPPSYCYGPHGSWTQTPV